MFLIKLTNSLWSITAKNTDCSTGPLARPFARSLAPLTRSLAPDCSLRSRPPLRSLVCSLAHFAHSLARGTVNDWMPILSVFFSIFDHSVRVERSGKTRRGIGRIGGIFEKTHKNLKQISTDHITDCNSNSTVPSSTFSPAFFSLSS